MRQLEIIYYSGKETYASYLRIDRFLSYFCLLRGIHVSYYKGYAYHQKMARENPFLLKWILQSRYF